MSAYCKATNAARANVRGVDLHPLSGVPGLGDARGTTRGL